MQPMAITVKATSEATSLGVTKIYQLIAEKRLDVVKVGRRTLVKTESIRKLLDVA